MYNIYKGRIKSVDKVKIRDNITTYTVDSASNTIGNSPQNKIFYNIQHSYQQEADNSDGVFRPGSLVFFIADSAGSGGAILCTISENPGSKLQLKGSLKDTISDIFKTTDAPPVTAGDFFWSKLDALVLFAYSGLIKLRSRLGLEILLNPVINKMSLIGKKIRLNFSGLEQNILEFGFEDEDAGEVNINLAFTTDTTGLDEDASLVALKLGSFKDKAKRFLFNITKLLTKEPKFTASINRDGDIDIKAQSLTFNFNNKAIIEFKEDGKVFIKPEEFHLGKGTTNQPMIRGKEFGINYDDLLDLLKDHVHSGDSLPSTTLEGLSSKKLQIDKELSKTKKID